MITSTDKDLVKFYQSILISEWKRKTKTNNPQNKKYKYQKQRSILTMYIFADYIRRMNNPSSWQKEYINRLLNNIYQSGLDIMFLYEFTIAARNKINIEWSYSIALYKRQIRHNITNITLDMNYGYGFESG